MAMMMRGTCRSCAKNKKCGLEEFRKSVYDKINGLMRPSNMLITIECFEYEMRDYNGDN